MPLDFAAQDSAFIVFRKPVAALAITLAKPVSLPVVKLEGPWTVAFQPDRGAPALIRLPALDPLSKQAAPGIRYFSGIATYSRSFSLPKAAKRGDTIWLDLGRVGDIAEVRINGQMVGTAWHAPYRLDIGKAVKPGPNRLEIKVANLWVNRLIGDAQPGAIKTTFTAIPTYTANAPLRPSGLIGPVTLSVEKTP